MTGVTGGRICPCQSRIAPAPEWKQGTPFGWNSWGSIQQHINFDKAIQVSDFFKENLQDQGFSNDSTLYIDLDSFGIISATNS